MLGVRGSEGPCACGRTLGAVRRLRRQGQTEKGFSPAWSPGSGHVLKHPIGSNIRVDRHPLERTAASLQRACLIEVENAAFRPVPRKDGCGAEGCVEIGREGWEPTSVLLRSL